MIDEPLPAPEHSDAELTPPAETVGGDAPDPADGPSRAPHPPPDAAPVPRSPPSDQHGTDPPAPVAAAMADSDVFLAPTTKSLSHTRARGAACDAGSRGATLPGITEDVFVTGLDADYAAIDDACDAMLAAVGDADEIRVTAPAGSRTFPGCGRRRGPRATRGRRSRP